MRTNGARAGQHDLALDGITWKVRPVFIQDKANGNIVMRRQSHSSKVKTIREEFIERGECGWRKNIKREEEGRGGRKENLGFWS
jgi:hypothetical protein